jgi:hypothetical protein
MFDCSSAIYTTNALYDNALYLVIQFNLHYYFNSIDSATRLQSQKAISYSLVELKKQHEAKFVTSFLV